VIRIEKVQMVERMSWLVMVEVVEGEVIVEEGADVELEEVEVTEGEEKVEGKHEEVEVVGEVDVGHVIMIHVNRIGCCIFK
jgi:glutamate 5-kinase